jgi:hypothetical protein
MGCESPFDFSGCIDIREIHVHSRRSLSKQRWISSDEWIQKAANRKKIVECISQSAPEILCFRLAQGDERMDHRIRSMGNTISFGMVIHTRSKEHGNVMESACTLASEEPPFDLSNEYSRSAWDWIGT